MDCHLLLISLDHEGVASHTDPAQIDLSNAIATVPAVAFLFSVVSYLSNGNFSRSRLFDRIMDTFGDCCGLRRYLAHALPLTQIPFGLGSVWLFTLVAAEAWLRIIGRIAAVEGKLDAILKKLNDD